MKIALFEEVDRPEVERPEDRDGKWATMCPCANHMWRGPGCDICKDSGLPPGWVLVDPIETREACRIQDHTWRVEFDAGGFHIECVDPHTPQEHEAMFRHGDFQIPGCAENSELREMLAGALRVKVDIVVEGGSYEYPNDVDVWYEIKEVELDA